MRILYITTISLTMNAFFKPHIEMLFAEGHQVDIACNDADLPLDNRYIQLGCKRYKVDFSRSPLSTDHIKAFGQLKHIIEAGNYDIVHCHTPTASVVTRLVCRKFRKKAGLRVFYTAHGFHFFKGAPKLNWLIFYPIERFCSRFTDKLITINQEDYTLAKKKFHAGEVCHVPGVGIDLARFENVQADRTEKRREIGVPEDAVVMISVGELSDRKNHKLVLQALKQLENKNVHYVIVGKGPLREELEQFARDHKMADRVHLLGYRQDIAQLYKASDICCFPSRHEGLPVALMEAMACGLSVACSRIRGNTDLIDENGGVVFEPHSVEDCCKAIADVLSADRKRMGDHNRIRVQNYSVDRIVATMKSIYES